MLRQGVVRELLTALPGARVVGGAVRDHLAGRPIHDIDVGSAFPPEEATTRLRQAGFRIFETGLDHGTVTAVRHGTSVEVTTLRRDVEADGRHASVAWTRNWREDAERRDFTINAMSMDAHGNLFDYFQGQADLRVGRVRFIADAATRIREDYLRSLRFFRFWARYGRGAPDAEAMAAIAGHLDGLRILSVERVWMEFKRLLEAPDPCDALEHMQASGVWPTLLAEAAPVDTRLLRELIRRQAPRDALLRFAALLPPGAPAHAIASRLKFSGDEAARLKLLRRRDIPPPASAVDKRGMRLFLLAVARNGHDPQPDAEAWLWLREAEGLSPPDIREALGQVAVPVFPLQGRDLLALGYAAGPEMGRTLQQLRAWWVAEGAEAGREACLLRLAELAKPGHA